MSSRAHAPTVVDLFSGAGGFSLGFRAAGFRLVSAADYDEIAAIIDNQSFHRKINVFTSYSNALDARL